jgi:LysM repeat protein/lysophospholipase L1-like esterase
MRFRKSLIAFLLAFMAWGEGQLLMAYPVDSLATEREGSLQKYIRYTHTYSFIEYEKNHWQWFDMPAMRQFFERFSQAKSRKVRVLHLGDSHVHYDLQTKVIRERLSAIWGNGGIGWIVPYSIAHTHGTVDYRSSHRGVWQSALITKYKPAFPLGSSGVTVYTEDPQASFTIRMNKGSYEPVHRKLRIFCRADSSSFDILVKTSPTAEPIRLHAVPGKPYVETILPSFDGYIEVLVNKSREEQRFFECYGLWLESVEDKGVVYSSAGVNGAGVGSWAKESLLAEEMAVLQPDLVVLDVGINDFYLNNHFDKNALRHQLVTLIESIRAQNPETVILLVSPQDAYRYRRNISACKDYAALLKELARAYHCAFYDYYHISGGQYSMMRWLQTGLAKRDRIHLTNNGYTVKGELYANAFLNSMVMALSVEQLATLDWQHADSAEKEKMVMPETENKAFQQVSYSPGENATKQVYTVRRGDSLGKIAQLYGVSIAELQRWNGLPDYFIYPGQKLVVYSNRRPQTTTPARHYVQRGDTLWGIARRYGVSVEYLKKINGLSSDALRAGTYLKLRP